MWREHTRELGQRWRDRRRTERRLRATLRDTEIREHTLRALARARADTVTPMWPTAALVGPDEITVLGEPAGPGTPLGSSWQQGATQRIRVTRGEMRASSQEAPSLPMLVLAGNFEYVPEPVGLMLDLATAPRMITIDGDPAAARAFAASLALQLFDAKALSVIVLPAHPDPWLPAAPEPGSTELLVVGYDLPEATMRRLETATRTSRIRALVTGRPVSGAAATFTVTKYSVVSCPGLGLGGIEAYGLGEAVAADPRREMAPAEKPRPGVPAPGSVKVPAQTPASSEAPTAALTREVAPVKRPAPIPAASIPAPADTSSSAPTPAESAPTPAEIAEPTLAGVPATTLMSTAAPTKISIPEPATVLMTPPALTSMTATPEPVTAATDTPEPVTAAIVPATPDPVNDGAPSPSVGTPSEVRATDRAAPAPTTRPDPTRTTSSRLFSPVTESSADSASSA